MPYSFRRESLQRLARIVDLLLVSVAFMVAMLMESSRLTWPSMETLFLVRVKLVNLFLFATYLVFCLLVFSAQGFYRSGSAISFGGRLAKIIRAVILIAGSLLLLREPLDLSFATNKFVLEFAVLSTCSLIVVHELSRMLQHIARLQGTRVRNVVIVGDDDHGMALAARIEAQQSLGYRVLRIITLKDRGA